MVLVDNSTDVRGDKLERWRKAMEKNELNWAKTEILKFGFNHKAGGTGVVIM